MDKNKEIKNLENVKKSEEKAKLILKELMLKEIENVKKKNSKS